MDDFDKDTIESMFEKMSELEGAEEVGMTFIPPQVLVGILFTLVIITLLEVALYHRGFWKPR